MDRGAWQTVVHEVAKSWAQLSDKALPAQHSPFKLGAGGLHG